MMRTRRSCRWPATVLTVALAACELSTTEAEPARTLPMNAASAATGAASSFRDGRDAAAVLSLRLSSDRRLFGSDVTLPTERSVLIEFGEDGATPQRNNAYVFDEATSFRAEQRPMIDVGVVERSGMTRTRWDRTGALLPASVRPRASDEIVKASLELRGPYTPPARPTASQVLSWDVRRESMSDRLTPDSASASRVLDRLRDQSATESVQDGGKIQFARERAGERVVIVFDPAVYAVVLSRTEEQGRPLAETKYAYVTGTSGVRLTAITTTLYAADGSIQSVVRNEVDDSWFSQEEG